METRSQQSFQLNVAKPEATLPLTVVLLMHTFLSALYLFAFLSFRASGLDLGLL